MKQQSQKIFFVWLLRSAMTALLLAAAIALVPFYARLWQVPIASIVPLLLPQFAVASTRMIEKNGEWLIAFDLVTQQSMVIDAATIPAGTPANASTLAAHAIKAPLLLLIAIVLWPLQQARQQLQRILLSVPAICVLTLLDIPFMIAGAIATLTNADNFLSAWAQWLDGGGRFALAIAAAVLIRMIASGAFIAQRAAARKISDPCV